ncbi:MAG: arylesterase [Gemmatimonadaceae bacterium]|nr:arylesterase [Gemmatimonadaceae bacterium]
MRKQQGSGKQGSLGRIVRRATGAGVALVMLATTHGCSSGPQAQPDVRVGTPAQDTNVATGQTPLPPGSSVDQGPKNRSAPTRVLFVGTSLTAGLGLDDPSLAWPGQVGHIADSLGYRIRVQNAGVSGETSAGALRRADWLLRDTADVVVIETGANDGLRGLPVADLRRNLIEIVRKVQQRQPAATVVVVQMEAPPNMGSDYSLSFGRVYADVAQATGAILTPFLLEGVAGVSRMNQPDGIHPTEEGAAKAARAVWPAIRAVLDQVQRTQPAL